MNQAEQEQVERVKGELKRYLRYWDGYDIDGQTREQKYDYLVGKILSIDGLLLKHPVQKLGSYYGLVAELGPEMRRDDFVRVIREKVDEGS